MTKTNFLSFTGATKLIDTFNFLALTGAEDINALQVDPLTHRVIKCSFWDKILNSIPFSSFAAIKEKNINQIIINIITQINEQLPDTQNQLQDKLNEKIRNLFFNKIGKLNNNPFNNNFGNNSTKKIHLSKKLQNVLSPELNNLRQANDYQIIKEKKRSGQLLTENEELFCLQKKIAKAELAIKLGVGIKQNTGTTGSVRLYSVHGKPKGVFKIYEKHVSWTIWIIQQFKRHTYGQSSYLSSRPAAQPKTEVLAAKLDRTCGFHLTPYSAFVEIAGKKGAFLDFLSGYKEAKEILEDYNNKENYSSREIDLFQKMAVYDYLIGNLDRHEENWFVKIEKGSLTDLRCIDNGNSFIKTNPNAATKKLLKNQYKWKKENIAEIDFSGVTKDFIRTNVSQVNINTFMQAMKADPKLKDIFETDPAIEDNFNKRLKVLQKLAQENFKFSPAQLGNLSTDSEIENFLN